MSRCWRWDCPVHNYRARRRYRKFMADITDQSHIAWAHGLVTTKRKDRA